MINQKYFRALISLLLISIRGISQEAPKSLDQQTAVNPVDLINVIGKMFNTKGPARTDILVPGVRNVSLLPIIAYGQYLYWLWKGIILSWLIFQYTGDFLRLNQKGYPIAKFNILFLPSKYHLEPDGLYGSQTGIARSKRITRILKSMRRPVPIPTASCW